jgi:hypothetical protein
MDVTDLGDLCVRGGTDVVAVRRSDAVALSDDVR